MATRPLVPNFTPTREQEAVLAHDPQRHGRVLAGPGTGKSATLVALVSQLLARVPRPRVRLLTFTRAATGELARKVSDHPAAAAERPSTIHSFAISVLLRNPGAVDFPQPLRIADDWEYKNIVRTSLARRAQVKVKTLDILVREMAANWESLRPEEDRRVDVPTRARFLGAWNEHRHIYGYTLLDELPYDLRSALRDHPDLEGVDYDLLIVDEYQDLNACDLEVLRLVASRGCSVIASGDDDQSIYSFRKAAPEGIRRFPDDYPGSADYPLSVTQRCGRRITEWASYVIEGDPDRPHGRPRLASAHGSPDGDVALLAFPDDGLEAEGIALLVERLIRTEEVSPPEVLVLLRSDHNGFFSSPIKQHLDRLRIPYSDPDAVERVLGEPVNRRVLEVCRLLVNRHDSIAWAALLHLTSGIGDSFFDYIYNLARQQHCQLGQALLNAYEQSFPDCPLGSGNRARDLTAVVRGWLEAHAPPREEPDNGWGHWILETVGNEAVQSPTQQFAELLIRLDEFNEQGQDLGRYLAQVSPLGRDLALAQSDGIRIMSMGGAKGLTVRATIIPALEEGLVPRPDGDLGEERRLLYVGMTRAKEFLYCTWARRRSGPTARAGAPQVGIMRRHSTFLQGGPVQSQDGLQYIGNRWQ